MTSPQAVAQPLVLSEFFAPLIEVSDGIPTLKLPAAGRLIGSERHELLEVGEVTINDIPRHGIGYSIQEMTYRKTVVFNLEPGNKG